MYSKTCVKRLLSRRPKIGFQDQLSLNAGQKYCRMLQGDGKHSALLLTFINALFLISLSYRMSLRSLFCLFLSGGFTQVLLFYQTANNNRADQFILNSTEQEISTAHKKLKNTTFLAFKNSQML